MRSVFVLPLYPLEDIVLLPGERCGLASSSEQLRAIVERAHDFGGAVVASLADGESVHEVGVTAIVSGEPGSEASLYGVSRCRLLSLVSEDVPMVRAERFPEAPAEEQRQATVARLLHTRYQRLLLRVGCEPVSISPGGSQPTSAFQPSSSKASSTSPIPSQGEDSCLWLCGTSSAVNVSCSRGPICVRRPRGTDGLL
jgi:hypothetical protein